MGSVRSRGRLHPRSTGMGGSARISLIRPEYIILHHTDDPSEQTQFLKINGSHISRGFPQSSLGWSVCYHYVIEQDGSVRQARRETEVGAHTVGEEEYDHMNFRSVGIAVAGRFTINSKQRKSLTILISHLQSRWSIPNENVLLHSEVDRTSCAKNFRELL